MRTMIKGGHLVTDHWQHVADEEALPQGPVTVSLARWKAERDTLIGRGDRIGVRLQGADPVDEIVPDLPVLAMVAVTFQRFGDGRGLSQARLLRERHGYDGEIRAVGDVRRDQLLGMRRCGIDAFELRADQDAQSALRAFDELSVCYQPTVEQPLPLFRRRETVA